MGKRPLSVLYSSLTWALLGACFACGDSADPDPASSSSGGPESTSTGGETIAGTQTTTSTSNGTTISRSTGIPMTGSETTGSSTTAQTEGGGESTTESDPQRCAVVDDVVSLRAALDGAQAGDCVALAPGLYAARDVLQADYSGAPRSAYFLAAASGTEAEPIILQAEDPDSPPILRGLGSDDSVYGLWIRGGHWQIRDIEIEQVGKGLILDEASGSTVSRVVVRAVGDEAIHLRSGTHDALIEDCHIDGAGLNQPGFGEGIYIGSDGGQWDTYAAANDRNTVRGCTIEGTRAEAIDVKEGTADTVIEDCDIFGGELSGENSADSFVDLKGVDARVRGNRFYKQANATVTRGVAIVERPNGPTAIGNWIYENDFFMDDEDGVMVHAFAGVGNCAWDNVRSPDGAEYQGGDPELCFDAQE